MAMHGAVERTNRWLEEKLVQSCTQWPEKLPYWQLLNNFLTSNTTGLNPMKLCSRTYHAIYVTLTTQTIISTADQKL